MLSTQLVSTNANPLSTERWERAWYDLNEAQCNYRLMPFDFGIATIVARRDENSARSMCLNIVPPSNSKECTTTKTGTAALGMVTLGNNSKQVRVAKAVLSRSAHSDPVAGTASRVMISVPNRGSKIPDYSSEPEALSRLAAHSSCRLLRVNTVQATASYGPD